MTEIEPPIVVSEGGDLAFHGTLREAELDLEPIDVRRGIYEVFDSAGRLLEPQIQETERPSAVFGPARVEVVRLRERAGTPAAADRLRAKILAFGAALPDPVEIPPIASLPDLVRWAHSRFGA